MFAKIKDVAVAGGYHLMRSKGVNCPDCERKLDLPADMPEGGMDAVISCQHCGWSDSFSGLFSLSRGDHLAPKHSKPAGCCILESVDGETHTWMIPAKKRFNFLLLFAAIWLLFVGVFTAAIAFGNPTDSATGEPPDGWGYLFLLPFWVAGLGVAYAGLRMSFTELILRVDGEKVTLLRKFFGKVWGKSIARDDVGTVSLKVAYRKNNSPVYHIYVENGNGKDIKFGSNLEQDEKRWMLGQLQDVLGKGAVPLLAGGRLAEHESKGLEIVRVGHDSFRVKNKCLYGKRLIAGGLLALVVGGIIISQTMDWGSVDKDGGGVFRYVFNLFDLVSLLAVLFVVITAVGAIVWGIRMHGRVVDYEFNPHSLTVTTRWRQTQKKQRHEKNAFHKVKRTNSGSVNDAPRYRVVLVGKQNSVTVCSFEDNEASSLLVAWLEQWLAEDTQADGGYAKSMDA